MDACLSLLSILLIATTPALLDDPTDRPKEGGEYEDLICSVESIAGNQLEEITLKFHHAEKVSSVLARNKKNLGLWRKDIQIWVERQKKSPDKEIDVLPVHWNSQRGLVDSEADFELE